MACSVYQAFTIALAGAKDARQAAAIRRKARAHVEKCRKCQNQKKPRR